MNSEKFKNIVKKILTPERKKRILPILLVAIGLSFIIFISTPIEIFANNADEFKVSLSSFLFVLILFFLLNVLICFVTLFFVPEKVYNILYAFTVAGAFMLFVQGNYLNFGIHSLAGDSMDESAFSTFKIIIDTILWLGVIAALVTLIILLKKKEILKTICLVLSVVVVITQVIGVMAATITGKDLNKKNYSSANGDSYNFLTTKNLMNISKDRNIFYFVVDRFDGTFAEKVLDREPDVFSNFTGFTYYSDHVSRYARTYPAVANMLTEYRNESGQNRKDFFEEAYKDPKTLKVLDDNGYQVNIFTDSYYAYEYTTHMPEYIDNMYKGDFKVKVKNPCAVAGIFVVFGLYRNLPLLLKKITTRISTNSMDWHIAIKFKDSSDRVYSTDNETVYDYVSNHNFNLVEDKVFSFVHIHGCHDLKPKSKYDDIEDEVEESIEIIDLFIRALKRLGAYENSTIVITGDHGLAYNNYEEISQTRLTALFVKPSGVSEGNVKFSTAQTSHENIWPTIFDSENIETTEDFGTSIFDIPEGVDQVRTFVLDYDFFFSSWKQAVYQINGTARDLKNWEVVERKIYNKGLYV